MTKHDNEDATALCRRTLTLRFPLGWAWACLLGSALGCEPEPVSYEPVATAQDTPPELAPELARLRQLQRVAARQRWVIPTGETGCAAGNSNFETFFEHSPTHELIAIHEVRWDEEEQRCHADVSFAADAATWLGAFATQCPADLEGCSQQRALCVISKISEVAAQRGGTVRYSIQDDDSESTLYFPPQSSGARAALYKLARNKTLEALNQVAINTKTGIYDAGSPCRGQLEALSTRFVELYHLYGDLTEAAAEAEIAAGDAQRSTAASLGEGVRRSTEGLELSRLSAARMFVDGRRDAQRPEAAGTEGYEEVGFPSPLPPDSVGEVRGPEQSGFCSVPQLRPAARKALSILRQAAPFPLDILAQPGLGTDSNDIAIEDIVSDPAPPGVGISGSVRRRLGVQPGYPQFNDDLCGGSMEPACITEPAAVAGSFGVTL